jgi:hypothetical protein
VVLLLGIFIGTFSSIFVATPVLHFIESKFPHKTPKKEQALRSHSAATRPPRSTGGSTRVVREKTA